MTDRICIRPYLRGRPTWALRRLASAVVAFARMPDAGNLIGLQVAIETYQTAWFSPEDKPHD